MPDYAIRRLRAYQLLSKIFGEGLSGAVYTLCGDIPSFKPLIPAQHDPDLASAEYQDLLGFNVLPYAGVYLAEDGKLGGFRHQQLISLYLAEGFESYTSFDSPDHISTQLAFLSFLSHAEMNESSFSNQYPEVSPTQRVQAEFLQNQLIPWSLPFLCAIKAQPHSFYAEVAELTQSLLIHHLQEYEFDIPRSFSLPTPLDILKDKKAGLKQIAEYLVRPIYSGVYFSKRDIKVIAGRLNIPTGFGSREQLLGNVIRSAISFDAFSVLVCALKDEVTAAKEVYEALNDTLHQGFDYIASQWIDQSERTLKMLDELESAGISASRESD